MKTAAPRDLWRTCGGLGGLPGESLLSLNRLALQSVAFYLRPDGADAARGV